MFVSNRKVLRMLLFTIEYAFLAIVGSSLTSRFEPFRMGEMLIAAVESKLRNGIYQDVKTGICLA